MRRTTYTASERLAKLNSVALSACVIFPFSIEGPVAREAGEHHRALVQRCTHAVTRELARRRASYDEPWRTTIRHRQARSGHADDRVEVPPRVEREDAEFHWVSARGLRIREKTYRFAADRVGASSSSATVVSFRKALTDSEIGFHRACATQAVRSLQTLFPSTHPR